MNKILLCLFCAGFLIGCTNMKDENLPPSRFIGIYGSYNGYVNGMLPTDNKNYSGLWKSADGLLIGHYSNGIPDQNWFSYYTNGQVEQSVSYYSDGQFLSMSYYPDGMPFMMIEGTCEFTNSVFNSHAQYSMIWDFYGNIASVTKDMTSDHRVFLSSPQSISGGIRGYASFCQYSESGNSFAVALYLIPQKMNGGAVKKLILNGSIKNNSEVIISEVKSSGAPKMKLNSKKLDEKLLKLSVSVSDSAQDAPEEIIIHVPLKSLQH